MMTPPFVTVIMPTYNCGAYIGEAISSVLSQTYHSHEIIVVDDGSTDNTQEILQPYIQSITYLRQSNRGASAARNLGIQQARGEFIAFLDADDVWLPTKLALQVQALQRYSEAGLVFTDFLDFDESGATRNSRFKTWPAARAWFERYRVEATDIAYGSIYQDLLHASWINTCSVVLVKRDVLAVVGAFDEAFTIGEDYDLWLRIAQRYPVLCVNRVLCEYRYRPQSLCGLAEERAIRTNRALMKVLDQHLRTQRIPRALEGLVNRDCSQRCWAMGWTLFGENRLVEARSRFWQGIRYQPFDRLHWLYLCATFLPLLIIEAIRRVRRWVRVFQGRPETATQ